MLIRTFNGFLLEFIENEALVCFVVKRQTVFYYLPAKLLKKAEVTMHNQPFQLQEFQGDDKIFYKAVALAMVPLNEPVELDEEHQKKLQYLLKHWD